MSDAIREGDMVLTPGEFGRVVGDASGPMVVVDHDGHHAVYQRDEVEAVVGVSERDAAIAERDRLREGARLALQEIADVERIYDATRQRKFAMEIAMLRSRIERHLRGES
jgi:hypothetical protein